MNEEMRAEIQSAFKAHYHQYPHGQKWMACPLITDEGMQHLMDSGQALLEMEPRATRFVSLGRTPLRIVQMASFLDNSKKEFGYIAFSGRFIRDGRLIPENVPSQMQRTAYRAYLEKLNLDPQSIIKNHSKENPLVIVEAVATAGGLLSFILILSTWARELGIDNELKNCIHIHVLRALESECQMPFEQDNCSGFALKQQIVDADLVRYLFESPEVFDDSLGQSYPVAKWSLNNMPPAMGENVSKNARLLNVHIADYVATHQPTANPVLFRRSLRVQPSCCEQLVMLGERIINNLGLGFRRD